ncbi:DUF1127 domain-containing protein [Pseudohoeflea coraliihabitans]|uniref:DUF1127 domain-containing protein n=1 Tax=Pseudohoeflea coraliihabitans TaxID=2860393 RepID=A0ABS6WQ89_9HYPH|nr:DUF1127 domain-containing protein [Pseudohoeflea sp. DP4N28-3]MBW3098137.1 DUF1127 domain-containing protein [Pseudohoeflea sp. DP4N28-3]
MSILNTARSWMRSRRTMHELASLSNDALADIGLTRHDIRRVARRLAN